MISLSNFSKFLALAATSGMMASASANDAIFPPLPAAKNAINFDGRGFLVNGKRTFIASGTIHYPRVPRALWRDRLLRLKRAGFNTVETYAFWNYHEEKEGQFDFSGEKDFGAFLKTAQEVGLWVIARPGPYVCAEWQSGGYPEWLRFKPGVRVRENNPQYLAAVDKWFEKVLPIIAANQIHRGGSVVMVQLENEHPRGWGTEMPSPDFNHLLEKARELKIEVPTFFSGLHHGADPAPRQPLSSAGRTNPWFSTEFWPGWYNLYGPLAPTGGRSLRQFDRGTWRILSHGGNGYNFYMLHGGTNFGTWNSNEDASSYDYGGAIGQTGDLRPIYYRFKRANLFATSFADILENSDNSSAAHQSDATGATIAARTSPAGTLVFLDNPGNEAVTARLQSGEEMRLDSGETVGLVRDFALNNTFKISQSAARILGFSRQGNTTTLVVYGAPGETGRVRFAFPTGAAAQSSSAAWQADGANTTLQVAFTDGAPQEHLLSVGPQRLRVLAMSKEMADKTYFVESKGASYVVCGTGYVSDFAVNNGRVSMTAEEQINSPGAPTVMIYGPDNGAQRLTPPKMAAPAPVALPPLQNWQTVRADAEALPTYKDTNWKTIATPLPMGADGDTSAYAWYRTTLRVPTAGNYNLNFSDVGDWALAYVNGQPVGSSRPRQRSRAPIRVTFPVRLQAGNNSLAVLTSHYGRDKLFNYLGPIDRVDVKGLGGPVTLTQGNAVSLGAVTTWRWRNAQGAAETPPADATGAGWQNSTTGQNTFNGRAGFAWYFTTLGNIAGPNRVVHFEDVDENATVYLNGQRLLQHEGYGSPFDVPLDAAWREGGPNTLAVLVQNESGAGGIIGEVELRNASATTAANSVTGWKMRGGVGNIDFFRGIGARNAWQPVSTAPTAATPKLYRTSFSAPKTPNMTPILRVSLAGLGRGFVWLNGQNLGRYPEKVPVEGIYLPENWLKAGANELIVLDETGASPQQVKLLLETPASRRVIRYGG
ncbi:MAG TPA: beta-galactosidase [Abditibacterium sp.]|jgi:beta-galactosidase